MDSRTNELLEKYWNAESTLAEEQELKELLKREEGLEEEKAIFRVFKEEGQPELDASFDAEILGHIEQDTQSEKEPKVISWTGFYQNYRKIAAAILVLLVSGIFYYNQQQTVQVEDTFEDPELAYKELKKQLLIVSNYLNKGSNTLNELNNLSKATNELEELGKLGQAAQGLEMLSEMNVENK